MVILWVYFLGLQKPWFLKKAQPDLFFFGFIGVCRVFGFLC